MKLRLPKVAITSDEIGVSPLDFEQTLADLADQYFFKLARGKGVEWNLLKQTDGYIVQTGTERGASVFAIVLVAFTIFWFLLFGARLDLPNGEGSFLDLFPLALLLVSMFVAMHVVLARFTHKSLVSRLHKTI